MDEQTQPAKLRHFLIVGICVLVLAHLAGSIYRAWRKQDIVALRREKLTELTAENDRLKERLEETGTEDFIERQAREVLGLVREGETTVRLPVDVPGLQASDSAEPVAGDKNLTNWQQWVALFW